MKLLLRSDRSATIQAVFHFYYSFLPYLDDIDLTISMLPEWNLTRFIRECIDETTSRFGISNKLTNPDEALVSLLKLYEARTQFLGLDTHLEKLIFELKNKTKKTSPLKTTELLDKLFWKIEQEIHEWYSDVALDETTVTICASLNTEIYTTNSDTFNKTEIIISINPASFQLETFINLPIDMIHEHLSHVYPYHKLGKKLTKDISSFDDGWMYFLAKEHYRINEYESLFPISKEYKRIFIETTDHKMLSLTGELGSSYKLARIIQTKIEHQKLQEISRILSFASVSEGFIDEKLHVLISTTSNPQEIIPEVRNLIVDSANLFFTRNRFRDCDKAFDFARSLSNGDNAYLYCLQANLYLQNDALPIAEKLFYSAIELNKNNVDALLGLSIISLRTFNFEKAKKFVFSAIELNPKNTAALMQLARVYFFADGDTEKSLRILSNLLNDIPDNIYALQAQYEIYLASGKKEDAARSQSRIQSLMANSINKSSE